MKVNFNNNHTSTHKFVFKAHPDFIRLSNEYNILASGYFRRGRHYGVPSNDFADVINSLKGIFDKYNKDIKKMLIAGIGESQEPFSMLAVIKYLINQKKLKKRLDLNIIDLQSKPEKQKLFVQSFLDDSEPPKFVPESFVKDEGLKYGLRAWMHYRVKKDIFKFLNKTYEDSTKSYWDSRVQDVIKYIPDNNYDVISANNTLGYIKDEMVIYDTVKNIVRTLKKDGIFITDPEADLIKNFGINETDEIYKGIYKKK